MTVERRCETCGGELVRRARDSKSQWALRRFCSQTCSNRSHAAEPVHLRFWKHVNKAESGCWIWIGSKDGGGYGTIATVRDGAPAKAHRISWEMRNGPIPPGMVICHKCDTPACVNPDHLFPGTQSDNARDMVSKGRLTGGEDGTACVTPHVLRHTGIPHSAVLYWALRHQRLGGRVLTHLISLHSGG